MSIPSLSSTANYGNATTQLNRSKRCIYPGSSQRWWQVANKSRCLVQQAGHLALKQLHLSYTATALERNLTLRQQMSRLLDTLGVHLQCSGQPMAQAGLFVANHISWLDAVVGAALQSASFIAKQEVKDWPLIGGIAEDMDTVYINRHNKFAVYRELPTLERHVYSGGSVFFFPEGTTSAGFSALPFYPMLFEVAARTGCDVQPVVIRYLDHQGHTLPEVAFIDEDSLTDSLWRLLKQSRITAQIEYLAPVSGSCRKHLARQCHAAIQKKLDSIPVCR